MSKRTAADKVIDPNQVTKAASKRPCQELPPSQYFLHQLTDISVSMRRRADATNRHPRQTRIRPSTPASIRGFISRPASTAQRHSGRKTKLAHAGSDSPRKGMFKGVKAISYPPNSASAQTRNLAPES